MGEYTVTVQHENGDVVWVRTVSSDDDGGSAYYDLLGFADAGAEDIIQTIGMWEYKERRAARAANRALSPKRGVTPALSLKGDQP